MIKSEICRAIAEKSEPRPAYKPAFRVKGIVVGLNGQLSKNGFWFYTCDESWQPVKMFDDESSNARLLDAMRQAAQQNDLSARLRLFEWFDAFIDRDADRKTAVVLAACKWLGIDYGTIEE